MGRVISIRDSIATRMLFSVLVLYLLIATGITASHVWIEYSHQKEKIFKELGDIEKAFDDGLAVNLWDLDEKALQASIKGMINLPSLVGVKITDTNQATVAIAGIINSNGKKGEAGLHVDLAGINDLDVAVREPNQYAYEIFERQFPINYNLDGKSIPLGNVTVYSDSSVIYKTTKTLVTMLAINVVITLLTFTLALLWAVNHYLRRPLRILTEATAGISLTNLGSFNVDTQTPGENEIKALGETITGMASGLHEAVSKRAEAEASLRESEERFRQLVENAPDAVFVRNKRGCFTYLNKAAIAIFGATSAQELIGTPIIERYHPNVREALLRRMQIINEQQHAVPLLQSICLQLNGNEINVETSAVPMNYMGEDGALVFMRNISDRVENQKRQQQLEEQLHQSQKIESLGRLAGGVAHDYNNMLSVIIGNVELAKMNTERSAPVEDNLEQILLAANRSKDITRQLLAFARKQIINPEVLDLNASLEGMLKMLRNLLGENIDLSWHPKGNLWPVKIDPSQLDQILANLCINARDAIDDVGKLTIETDAVCLDEDYCKDHQGFIPGDYSMLAVSDNGCGMDQETLNNLFEPFFTTKGVGKGTGLGLATVYGIVKQSNGFINVYSEPDHGTTFKIYLPRCKEDMVAKETTAGEVQNGQGETVLLVEDEVAIVKLSTAMLEDLGYRVLAANSPVEALKLAEVHQGEIQLLLTDVVMPEMNGRDLAEQIKNMHPNLDVLYMSGYTANVIAHHGVLDEGINFIQKPFSRGNLSIRIREVLGRDS